VARATRAAIMATSWPQPRPPQGGG
jgi:hypothetical protein